MRFRFQIVLNRRQQDVWDAFYNLENLKKWQPTFVSHEPQAGTPGEVGATAKLTYLENNRPVVLTEIVTLKEPPSQCAGTYEMRNAVHHVHNHFEDLGDGTTQWTANTEFQLRGIWKLFTPLIRSGLRKRLSDDFHRFRDLLEAGEFDPPN